MLDAQFIRDHREAVKTNCRNRAVTADIDRVVALDDQRKELLQKTQVLQQRRNEISKLIAKEKDQDKKQTLSQEGRELRDQVAALEALVKQVDEDLRLVLVTIPNMTHPDAPVGATPADNKVIRVWGDRRHFDFPVKDHVTLAESLNLADFEAGAAVAGPKFFYLKNEGVLLELALVQYAFQKLLEKGYTPIITPDVVRVEVLEGIGFMPRGPETQIYSLANTDLCLIATAEITLGGMHRNQIMDELQLPIKYVGLSHCFRTEAGARGVIRAGSIASTSSQKWRCSFSARPTRARRFTLSFSASRKRSSRAWGCRITSLTRARATSEARPIASTISRRGCRCAARGASTAR